MFIISIILVALPLKRHRGFKFQAPITPQMFFVPENIPNCLQKGNNFRKKPFLLLLSRLLLAREMMLKVRKWQSRPEEGIRSLPWVRGGLTYWGYADGVRGEIELSKFLPIFTLTASF